MGETGVDKGTRLLTQQFHRTVGGVAVPLESPVLEGDGMTEEGGGYDDGAANDRSIADMAAAGHAIEASNPYAPDHPLHAPHQDSQVPMQG